jgi:hypothetical protein
MYHKQYPISGNYRIILLTFLILCVQLAHCMAPTTAAGAEREKGENRLQVELGSLGMDCKRKNELNGKGELEALDKEGWPRVDY